MIANEVVGIRAIEKDDLKLLQRWRNNENLRRYFREYREFSLSQKEKWYDSMINDDRFEMFMIYDNFVESKDPVGVAGFTYIDWLNKHCDLHFYIGQDAQWIDEKYAPRALELMLKRGFHIMNMNKIWAEIYEIDNKKLEFFKKAGFAIDATLRQHYYYNGKYYNSHILSLLRGDYEKSIGNSCTPRR